MPFMPIPNQKMPEVTDRKDSCLCYPKDIRFIGDLFSASWLMNVRQFMGINVNRIATCEDGCFQPFRQCSNDVRMTRDWLECAVEHMSKWWKIVDIFRHQQTLEAFIEKLDGFGHESATETPSAEFRNTIAIIAFMPFGGETIKGQGQALTIAMLKACLRSLSRYGIGRIVVAVPSKTDRDTYERLVPAMLGETTVVFRAVSIVRTRFVTTNMPYAAIVGLQRAFRSDVDDWLGSESRWSSVYLTEPDTLLHLKPQVLPDLMSGVLNDGWIFSPHRLQPIPHASDLSFPLSPVVVVPDNEDHKVITVDSYETCLWDSGNDRPYGAKHTNPQKPKRCGSFWYMCGFLNGDHTSIRSYDLMRLTHGIGITMLMGSEHGRQCHLTPEDTTQSD